MSYKDIKPGDYAAVPTGIRLIKSAKNTPGVEVGFKFQVEGKDQHLNYVGWLTSAALENTMKTLVEVLGFNGDDELKPGCINMANPVTVVVEFEKNPEDQKEYPRIKWVNAISRSAFAGVEVEKVKTELGALGFKAAFLAAKKTAPATTQEQIPF